MADKYAGGLLVGAQSVSIEVILRSTSNNVEFAGATAAAITSFYHRQGGTITAITLSDLANYTAAWATGGWVSGTQGLYRLDVPNAAVTSGADFVTFAAVAGTTTYVFFERYALTTNVVQSGDSFARIGATGSGLTSLASSSAATAIQALLPAALVGGRMDAAVGAMAANTINPAAISSAGAVTIAAAVYQETRAGHTTAGTYGEAHSSIYNGSVTGATTVTTLIDSGLTQTGVDFWKGRIVIFTSGALKYQASDITAFDGASKITFTAMTASAAGADLFIIV